MVNSDRVPFGAVGSTHRHYKGGWYKVLCEALHTETNETMIVYQHIFPHEQKVYVRPKEMFYGVLPNGMPRFEEIVNG